jgi:hypothetical protein
MARLFTKVIVAVCLLALLCGPALAAAASSRRTLAATATATSKKSHGKGKGGGGSGPPGELLCLLFRRLLSLIRKRPFVYSLDTCYLQSL